MRHHCGIDFGTSNSVISVISTPSGGQTRGDSGAAAERHESLLEPSVMFFPANDHSAAERHIGQAGIERYLASHMNGRFFQSVKTLLPDPDFLHTRINGKPFKPEDLVAAMLRHLRTAMEARLNAPLDSLVLGRPARFSTDPARDRVAQDRLERAAKQAGFTGVSFELEPIAAAWAYERTLAKPELVLVGDFGGGTSDFTIMRLDPARSGRSERQEDILGTAGVYVGGDAFDSDIMRSRVIEHFGSRATFESFGKQLPVPVHIFNTICRWEQIHFLKTNKAREEIREMMHGSTDRAGLQRLLLLIEKDLSYGLTKAVQKAKHNLSDKEDAAVFYRVPEFTIAQALSRRDFEAAIDGHVQVIRDCTAEVLAQGGLRPSDISAVFLTGGSSRVLAIRGHFERLFGAGKVHIDSDQFMSVAHGLALKARELDRALAPY